MAPLPGGPQPRILLLPAAANAAPGTCPGAAAANASSPPPTPRKRQRLAHLSAEEKALRRKLKNRVAAQSARDRKKARMGELERQAVDLEAQNLALLAENEALRERALNLALENRQLRLRLGLPAAADQSDLFLGLLDNLDPDLFLHFEGLEQMQQEEEECGGETAPLPTSPRSPLGASPSKLEALNELVHFDHEYTKPFIMQIAAEVVSQVGTVGGGEGASLLSENILLEPSLSMKEEPMDVLLPKLGVSHLFSADQKPPMDASSDSGYEYTKPFIMQIAAEVVSQAGTVAAGEGAALLPENVLLEPSLSVKEEPMDALLPELGVSHLLSADQKPPMDASSDSGYEGSPSPFSDLSSPLGTDYVWDEAFANELFPQLISV